MSDSSHSKEKELILSKSRHHGDEVIPVTEETLQQLWNADIAHRTTITGEMPNRLPSIFDIERKLSLEGHSSGPLSQSRFSRSSTRKSSAGGTSRQDTLKQNDSLTEVSPGLNDSNATNTDNTSAGAPNSEKKTEEEAHSRSNNKIDGPDSSTAVGNPTETKPIIEIYGYLHVLSVEGESEPWLYESELAKPLSEVKDFQTQQKPLLPLLLDKPLSREQEKGKTKKQFIPVRKETQKITRSITLKSGTVRKHSDVAKTTAHTISQFSAPSEKYGSVKDHKREGIQKPILRRKSSGGKVKLSDISNKIPVIKKKATLPPGKSVYGEKKKTIDETVSKAIAQPPSSIGDEEKKIEPEKTLPPAATLKKSVSYDDKTSPAVSRKSSSVEAKLIEQPLTESSMEPAKAKDTSTTKGKQSVTKADINGKGGKGFLSQITKAFTGTRKPSSSPSPSVATEAVTKKETVELKHQEEHPHSPLKRKLSVLEQTGEVIRKVAEAFLPISSHESQTNVSLETTPPKEQRELSMKSTTQETQDIKTIEKPILQSMQETVLTKGITKESEKEDQVIAQGKVAALKPVDVDIAIETIPSKSLKSITPAEPTTTAPKLAKTTKPAITTETTASKPVKPTITAGVGQANKKLVTKEIVTGKSKATSPPLQIQKATNMDKNVVVRKEDRSSADKRQAAKPAELKKKEVSKPHVKAKMPLGSIKPKPKTPDKIKSDNNEINQTPTLTQITKLPKKEPLAKTINKKVLDDPKKAKLQKTEFAKDGTRQKQQREETTAKKQPDMSTALGLTKASSQQKAKAKEAAAKLVVVETAEPRPLPLKKKAPKTTELPTTKSVKKTELLSEQRKVPLSKIELAHTKERKETEKKISKEPASKKPVPLKKKEGLAAKKEQKKKGQEALELQKQKSPLKSTKGGDQLLGQNREVILPKTTTIMPLEKPKTHKGDMFKKEFPTEKAMKSEEAIRIPSLKILKEKRSLGGEQQGEVGIEVLKAESLGEIGYSQKAEGSEREMLLKKTAQGRLEKEIDNTKRRASQPYLKFAKKESTLLLGRHASDVQQKFQSLSTADEHHLQPSMEGRLSLGKPTSVVRRRPMGSTFPTLTKKTPMIKSITKALSSKQAVKKKELSAGPMKELSRTGKHIETLKTVDDRIKEGKPLERLKKRAQTLHAIRMLSNSITLERRRARSLELLRKLSTLNKKQELEVHGVSHKLTPEEELGEKALRDDIRRPFHTTKKFKERTISSKQIPAIRKDSMAKTFKYPPLHQKQTLPLTSKQEKTLQEMKPLKTTTSILDDVTKSPIKETLKALTLIEYPTFKEEVLPGRSPSVGSTQPLIERPVRPEYYFRDHPLIVPPGMIQPVISDTEEVKHYLEEQRQQREEERPISNVLSKEYSDQVSKGIPPPPIPHEVIRSLKFENAEEIFGKIAPGVIHLSYEDLKPTLAQPKELTPSVAATGWNQLLPRSFSAASQLCTMSACCKLPNYDNENRNDNYSNDPYGYRRTTALPPRDALTYGQVQHDSNLQNAHITYAAQGPLTVHAHSEHEVPMPTSEEVHKLYHPVHPMPEEQYNNRKWLYDKQCEKYQILNRQQEIQNNAKWKIAPSFTLTGSPTDWFTMQQQQP